MLLQDNGYNSLHYTIYFVAYLVYTQQLVFLNPICLTCFSSFQLSRLFSTPVSVLYIHSFVLFFRFYIYVKSYSICLSSSDLVHNKHNILQVHLHCCKWQDVHLSVEGHLGCFHILETVNSAAIITEVLVPFQISGTFWTISPGVGLLGHMVRQSVNSVAQSCPTLCDPMDGSIFSFGEPSILFSMAAAPRVHSHQHWWGIRFSLRPLSHLLRVDFLMTAILTGVRWFSFHCCF